jgi:hypothetical protein
LEVVWGADDKKGCGSCLAAMVADNAKRRRRRKVVVGEGGLLVVVTGELVK